MNIYRLNNSNYNTEEMKEERERISIFFFAREKKKLKANMKGDVFHDLFAQWSSTSGKFLFKESDRAIGVTGCCSSPF